MKNNDFEENGRADEIGAWYVFDDPYNDFERFLVHVRVGTTKQGLLIIRD